MKIIKTKFKGLLIIKGTRHDDNRGYLREMILEKEIKQNLKFQIASVSKKMFLGTAFSDKKTSGKINLCN